MITFEARATFGYLIDPEQRAIAVRYAGTFSMQELVASARLLWADPRYSPNYVGVVDLSQASIGASMSDFRTVIDFVLGQASASRGRWAAVATSPLVTACAMIYRRAVIRRHPFEVFSTWEAACEHLGVVMPVEFPVQVLPEDAAADALGAQGGRAE